MIKHVNICQTQNSISRRMTEHLQNGALKNHMRNIHIIYCKIEFDDIKKQKIYEALIILKERKNINRQNEDS